MHSRVLFAYRYCPGDVEYVPRPRIESIQPDSGPVKGGVLVTLTHSRVPLVNLNTLEAKIGQFYAQLTRISDREMMFQTPPHTVYADPNWYFPGALDVDVNGSVFNRYVSVEIFSVSFDAEGAKRTKYDNAESNSGGARFWYRCSSEEIFTQTCCPSGSAGLGGQNGSFCFECEQGKFAPLVGTTACLTCPPNSRRYAYCHNHYIAPYAVSSVCMRKARHAHAKFLSCMHTYTHTHCLPDLQFVQRKRL